MKMNKKNILESAASNKNIIFGILGGIFICSIFLLPFINKGTYSEIEDTNRLIITCPETAEAGETIECDISVNAVSMNNVSGISAKYIVTDGLEYVGFYLDESFAEYEDLIYKDYAGFVLVKDEITGNVGSVKYVIPSDAIENSLYKIELVDIIFGDGESIEVQVDDEIAEITIKSDSSEEPELSDINTLDNINVTNGVFDKTFDKNINSYVVTVDDDTFSISVTPTDDKSLISGFEDSYTFGENLEMDIEIKVTSESGKENIYSLMIIRKKEECSLNFSEDLDIDEDKKYIKFISVGTTGTLLFEDITVVNGNIKLYDKDNNEKDVSLPLASGDILRIYSSDELKDEYTISVIGDSSGDGRITTFDLTQMRKHIVGYKEKEEDEPYKKTGVYELALDLNGDGKVATMDVVKLRMIIAGVK